MAKEKTFKCCACESTVEGEDPIIHPTEKVMLCSDCYCKESPTGYHSADWETINCVSDGEHRDIYVTCKHCGLPGHLGDGNCLDEIIDW